MYKCRRSIKESDQFWRLEIDFLECCSNLSHSLSGWRRVFWKRKKSQPEFVKHQSESNEGFRLLVLMLWFEPLRKPFLLHLCFLSLFLKPSDVRCVEKLWTKRELMGNSKERAGFTNHNEHKFNLRTFNYLTLLLMTKQIWNTKA